MTDGYGILQLIVISNVVHWGSEFLVSRDEETEGAEEPAFPGDFLE